jgi:hypothetical protein
MWDRPSTAGPIFEEALPPDPEHMWGRDTTGHAPACPCCLFGVPPPPPGVVTRPATGRSRPGTASAAVGGGGGAKALRSVPSSVGLRLKRSMKSMRSMRNLRRSASDESV